MVQCLGTTSKSQQCKRSVVSPALYCHQHQNQYTRVTKASVVTPPLPPPPPPMVVQYMTTVLKSNGNWASDMYSFFMDLTIPRGAMFLNFTTVRPSMSVIHFTFTFTREPVKYACEPNCPSWDDIKCDVLPMGIRTNCRDRNGKVFSDKEGHRRAKLFVNGVSDMLDYVKQLKSGKITQERHNAVWTRLHKMLLVHVKWTLLNHNRDVNTLHFKYDVQKPTPKFDIPGLRQ
jgi:hypothetical protein